MKRCHLRLPHHSSNVVQLIKQKECNGESAQKKVMEEMITPKPNNYMALAIFTTVCCCPPVGIYAIIRAMKVNDYYLMKQYDAATLASNDAKNGVSLYCSGCNFGYSLPCSLGFGDT